MSKRQPGVWLDDTWFLRDKKTRSKRYGKWPNSRWRVRWIDLEGASNVKSFARKVDAKKFQDKIAASFTTGTYVNPAGGDTTVGTVLDSLLATKTGKPKTVSGYRSVIEARVRPRWGNVSLQHVVKSDAQAWLKDLMEGKAPAAEPKTEGRRGKAKNKVKPRTAREAGRLLKESLELAVDDRLIQVNPLTKLKLPAQDSDRDMMPFTRSELFDIADQIERDEDRVLVLLMGLTGLRWGEAVALTPKAISFEPRRRIRVFRNYVEVRGVISEGTPKSHEARTVPFGADLEAELKPLLKDQPLNADIFRGRRGGVPRGSNWLDRTFRPAISRAEIPKAEDRIIHDCRHTCATMLISQGKNIKQIQAMLGHKSAKLTLDVYGHLMQDDFDDLETALDSGVYVERTSEPNKVASLRKKTG